MATSLEENHTDCSGDTGECAGSLDCILWGEVFQIVFCSLVITFGLPGNCLILCVYWTKPRKTSTNILIMGLAWADLFACLFLTDEIAASCLVVVAEEWETVLLILKCLRMVAVSLSTGITASIAVDRYDCVCRSSRRLLTAYWAKVAILCSLIFSILLQIIYVLHVVDPTESQMKITTLTAQFVMFVISAVLIFVCYFKVFAAVRRHAKVGVHTWLSDGNSTQRIQSTNAVPNISEWQLTATATYNSVRMLTLPCNVLTGNPTTEAALKTGCVSEANTCSTLIPTVSTGPGKPTNTAKSRQADVSLERDGHFQMKRPETALDCRRIAGPRRAVPKTRTIQGRTTLMLFLTSVLFVLSWLPYWFYVGLSIANIAGQSTSSIKMYTFEKMTIFLYVNHAINPFLYGLANRRFRKDCKIVLKKFFSQ